MKTIITYYSESGSAAEVGKMLAKRENVSYIAIEELMNQENLQCDLLIVGSPNKYGKLAPPITELLQKHRETLSKTSVIIYFTCMDFCVDKFDPVEKDIYVDSWLRDNIKEKMSSWDKSHSAESYINNIEKLVPGLNIQSMAIFKGRLNFSELRFFDALVMRFICIINRSIKPGDYLKQEDVNEWIDSLKLGNNPTDR